MSFRNKSTIFRFSYNIYIPGKWFYISLFVNCDGTFILKWVFGAFIYLFLYYLRLVMRKKMEGKKWLFLMKQIV